MTTGHIQSQLAAAQASLTRLTPRRALAAQQRGGYIVDTRPEYQRRADGDIAGAIVIERNHLEWRLDPCSASHIAEASSHDITWIVLCDEGFSSSLAAVSLRASALDNATDVIGGFQRWRQDGCAVEHGGTPKVPRVAKGDDRPAQPSRE